MNYRDILAILLPKHEGVRPYPYRDDVGKLTIGVGHNLTDNGLSKAAIAFIQDEDTDIAERAARALIPTFDALSDVRKAVVIDMAFNLGQLRFSEFRLTLAAINEGRWADAAAGMLDSAWAHQVGVRATELANMMRSDTWTPPNNLSEPMQP